MQQGVDATRCSDEQYATHLRSNLEEAKTVFQRAKAEYARLVAISKDKSAFENPAQLDGNLTLRQAMRLHFDARIKHQRARLDLRDFILHAKRSARAMASCCQEELRQHDGQVSPVTSLASAGS